MSHINELINFAVENEDQTKVSSGGDFEYTPPEAGKTLGRLISYVELGKQKQYDYKTKKEKPAVDEVRLVFELLNDKNLKEYEVDGEKKVMAERMVVTLTKKLNDKSRYFSLFKAMDYGRGKTHMAQFLGEPFVLEIFHTKSKTAPERVYASLYKDKKWGIGPAQYENPVTNEVIKVDVREALSPLQIFLWDRPTKESWDSLYISGTRTVKDDKGNEVERSKNVIQETILKATNFEGSPLHDFLINNGGVPEADLEDAIDEASQYEDVESDEDEEVASEMAVEASTKATDKPKADKASTGTQKKTTASTASKTAPEAKSGKAANAEALKALGIID